MRFVGDEMMFFRFFLLLLIDFTQLSGSSNLEGVKKMICDIRNGMSLIPDMTVRIKTARRGNDLSEKDVKTAMIESNFQVLYTSLMDIERDIIKNEFKSSDFDFLSTFPVFLRELGEEYFERAVTMEGALQNINSMFDEK